MPRRRAGGGIPVGDARSEGHRGDAAAGGVGATALLSQLATRFAEREARQERVACLIDLDVQFGDAAFQLRLGEGAIGVLHGAKTLVLHPASTTHQQLTAEQLVSGGIPEDLIRISVGIEDVEDILWDLDQALEAAVNATLKEAAK